MPKAIPSIPSSSCSHSVRRLVVTLAALALPLSLSAADGAEVEWKMVSREVRQAAERLRDAIVRKDIQALLKFVGKDGFHCGDDVTPGKAVKAMLRTPGNWLYDELFDTDALRRQGQDRLSIRDFFLRAEGLEIEIGLEPSSLRHQLDFPCMVFRARDPEETRFFCFYREGRRWVVSNFEGC